MSHRICIEAPIDYINHVKTWLTYKGINFQLGEEKRFTQEIFFTDEDALLFAMYEQEYMEEFYGIVGMSVIRPC